MDNSSLAHSKWNYKDHIHMLVSIPPKLSVAQFMGYFKGKSSLMIFDRHANINTEIDTFGVKDIMLILLEEIKMQ